MREKTERWTKLVICAVGALLSLGWPAAGRAQTQTSAALFPVDQGCALGYSSRLSDCYEQPPAAYLRPSAEPSLRVEPG